MEFWYAVHSMAQKESLAARELHRRGFTTFWPHCSEWVGTGHKARSRLVKRSWLSRYLFVRTGKEELWAVNEVPGVSTIVYAAGQDPYPIPDVIMDALLAQADPRGEIFTTKKSQRSRFNPGQVIRLLDEKSPLFGLYVEVIKTLDNGNICGTLLSQMAGTGKTILTAPVIGEVVERTA